MQAGSQVTVLAATRSTAARAGAQRQAGEGAGHSHRIGTVLQPGCPVQPGVFSGPFFEGLQAGLGQCVSWQRDATANTCRAPSPHGVSHYWLCTCGWLCTAAHLSLAGKRLCIQQVWGHSCQAVLLLLQLLLAHVDGG